VVFGPDGTLYGTTIYGGGGSCLGGCGTVYNLKPPPTACKTALCPWTETILYRFTNGQDGASPGGDLVFDQQGNIYGMDFGVANDPGAVYELTRSGGTWTERTLYHFSGGADGAQPYGGVTFDPSGNIYGVTRVGGAYSLGTVFQLTPSGSGWTENVLYSFQNGSDGEEPLAGLILDGAGNLYGTSSDGGTGGGVSSNTR